MGGWITLGILALLAILPLGVRIRYDAAGPLVKAIIGPVQFALYPRRKRERKPPEKKSPERTSPEKPKADAPSDNQRRKEPVMPEPPQPPQPSKKEKNISGGSLADFLPFVKLGLDFLGDFRRKLRVKDLYLRLILASSDPCDLAVGYGKAWTAVGSFLPALERWLVIKKRDVEVECDFTASETKVIARMDITMTLGRLLTLVAVYACRGLKEFIQFRNIRKGGAVK